MEDGKVNDKTKERRSRERAGLNGREEERRGEEEEKIGVGMMRGVRQNRG